ncbi:hypothetical protein ACIGB8_29170 [Promicromonospora sukumoe]|uniref:hypothetical protein n=1 Tax=Promicromonospora sukumoe TaxID=88382 RepID=UPI0037C6C1EC
MTDLTAVIRNATVQTADQLMRQTGFCPPPSVHMLTDDPDHPYLGFVSCRLFHRGTDAATAVTDLGLLPSVLGAKRLLVTWEDCDLRTALQQTGVSFPTAVVTLEATMSKQTLAWHPFDVRVGPRSTAGVSTAVPRWQPTTYDTNPTLLPCITGLLDLWRQARDGNAGQTIKGLRRAGYMVNLATRT